MVQGSKPMSPKVEEGDWRKSDWPDIRLSHKPCFQLCQKRTKFTKEQEIINFLLQKFLPAPNVSDYQIPKMVWLKDAFIITAFPFIKGVNALIVDFILLKL